MATRQRISYRRCAKERADMTAKLDGPLKRELEVGGALYALNHA